MEECSICLTEKSKTDYVYLNCFHNLCCSCFKKLNKKTCPFCRTKIDYRITCANKIVITDKKIKLSYFEIAMRMIEKNNFHRKKKKRKRIRDKIKQKYRNRKKNRWMTNINHM